MNVAVVVFPGSSGEEDAVAAYQNVLECSVKKFWHQEEAILGADLVVIPGGSSFGDYLRPGSLAAKSPIAAGIRKFAKEGGPVIGLGNGFQILCELGILPGILIKNKSDLFLNSSTNFVVENQKSCWTSKLQAEEAYKLPLSCDYGCYYADKRTLRDLEEGGHVAFRFSNKDGEVDFDAPFNDSLRSIAGVLNREENVLGTMFHPERWVEELRGSTLGKEFLLPAA